MNVTFKLEFIKSLQEEDRCKFCEIEPLFRQGIKDRKIRKYIMHSFR